MSGIVGLINRYGQPVDRELLERLTEFLTFRGPDDQGVWIEGPVGLGHTLLRTTFESECERQPGSLYGQVWITADARLDGRADLIKQLEARGCARLSHIPDVELILHAYQVWGDDCVQHLLGDFAFAIWDGPRRRLFCARDHLGVKPFYYTDAGRSLIFSNTLNCIRKHPDVSDRLNDLAIADFLLFDFNQDPATTTFADVRRLPPAHCLTWQEGGAVQVRRYWSLPTEGPVRYRRPRDYVDHFRELLRQAVADRLRAHKVGVFMSGGLDSPIVAATANKLLLETSAPFDFRAYTNVYDRLIPDDERYFSSLVAEHLNISIRHLPVDDYYMFEGWCDPARRWPEPQNEPLLAGWLDLIKLAGERSRVILTGEGGDEVLQASPAYFYKMLRGLHLGRLTVEVGRCLFIHGRLPQVRFRSTLRGLLNRGQSSLPYPSWLNQSFVARLDLRGRWEQFRQSPVSHHPLRPEAYQRILSPIWPENFVNNYDPGVTGFPVEFRHPLLDMRLVNFALSLPPLPWCVDKLLLRQAGHGLLPETVCRRPKTPLQGNPDLKYLQKPEAKELDTFTPCQELANYVQYRAIPPVTTEMDEEKLWTNLRPLSLNYWLHHLKADYPDKFLSYLSLNQNRVR